ncbi:hypothetical protein A2291_06565 [candidate division WOR-1 bacterium RIFOXYB2_FULL_42_35]|uniref:Yip1 domain-containing protein n=1 Tax=candidate division WOR-1 bacterium RIFOXYC2_FULL_41_25 TaxID=1802586 RepID=A0A1F4TPH6_UNCSA|nr:MAG: hypothetical protein A2291_06565 [candidate division WOR-1 bacterium RIFOXYB2_FULL_42_35]OGC24543.1 MAG: hypothetical protein A2247_06345 [candidate division WOR-1 bacterium RIFOXYA2_FULL_41_14]OGC34588.1 MAG: hypothetical protein A2462_04580 [candidate division WOR-1 bacterium RIFOXYC2_FULL_41_25]OGC44074.1 MAG: hypothetical protein A2548_07145 [candidate division WOR-1 bacterium RIFOXYD2_FULL_41_8]
MTIKERVLELVFNPRIAWQSIKEEKISAKQLFVNYAAPLALIPPVASLIGLTIFGIRMPSGAVMRAPFNLTLLGGIVAYIFSLAILWLGALIIKSLAPYFESKVDFDAAMKVVVYSTTPTWVVGIFSLVPGLGVLSLLGLYGVYLLVLGLSEILGTPGNKSFWFVVVILLLALIANFIISGLLLGTIYGPMYLRMMAA